MEKLLNYTLTRRSFLRALYDAFFNHNKTTSEVEQNLRTAFEEEPLKSICEDLGLTFPNLILPFPTPGLVDPSLNSNFDGFLNSTEILPIFPEEILKWRPLVLETCRDFRFPHPNIILTIISLESRGDQKAKSYVGATGLMQIMPQLGSLYGVSANYLYDPKTNLQVGVRFLDETKKKFQKLSLSGIDLWRIVSVNYNGGPNNAGEYRDVEINKVPDESLFYAQNFVRFAFLGQLFLELRKKGNSDQDSLRLLQNNALFTELIKSIGSLLSVYLRNEKKRNGTKLTYGEYVKFLSGATNAVLRNNRVGETKSEDFELNNNVDSSRVSATNLVCWVMKDLSYLLR